MTLNEVLPSLQDNFTLSLPGSTYHTCLLLPPHTFGAVCRAHGLVRFQPIVLNIPGIMKLSVSD